MRKMYIFVLAAVALLLTVPTQNAQAQSRSETPKVEIGAHYTVLRFSDFDQNDNGVGARLTYNLSDNFGLETEFNFFPQERINFANLTSPDTRRTQGLFGAKYGVRSREVRHLRQDQTWLHSFRRGRDHHWFARDRIRARYRRSS